MKNVDANEVLKKLMEDVELPESAYERAKERYKSIGEWLDRESSTCAAYDPHVFPGGSFRLGTANKPVDGRDAYDLDIECELQTGINKDSFSQKDLKKMVGRELEQYRTAKGIQKTLDEKRRCWTLEYSDHFNFHMDIVPCIPESASQRAQLRDSMMNVSKIESSLAGSVASLAVSITDNEKQNYSVISPDWLVSNPEGYAKWFEYRMRQARQFLDERMAVLKASIEELPHYRWKTPLQQAIQILKQHRDMMFRHDNDGKPISIIITTLSAHAYQGEGDLASALKRILNDMDRYIHPSAPYVPNPINPEEDFADKWDSPDHVKHNLKENFGRWLMQARADFKTLLEPNDPVRIVDVAKRGLGINVSKTDIASMLGVSITPATAAPSKIQASSPRPWAPLTERGAE